MISNTDKEIISNQAETIKILKVSLAAQTALTQAFINDSKLRVRTKFSIKKSEAESNAKETREIMIKRMEDIGATLVSIKPELFSADSFPSDAKINGAVEYLKRKAIKQETKMVEFNLERALAGDKVINACGESIEQIASFNVRGGLAIAGTRDMNLYTYTEEELFMAPKPLSGWVNVYENITTGKMMYVGSGAKLPVNHEYVLKACIDLSQHNEGEGLE